MFIGTGKTKHLLWVKKAIRRKISWRTFIYSTIPQKYHICFHAYKFQNEKKMSVKLVLIKSQEMSIIKNGLEANYTHCQNEMSSQDTLNFGICSGL